MSENPAIFKVAPGKDWEDAVEAGIWAGAAIDLQDGFIHFSTAPQLGETLRRHFAGQAGLVLIAFDAADFGAALKWEPSRGGDLFPHLYGALDPTLAKQRWDLSLGEDGVPLIPEGAI